MIADIQKFSNNSKDFHPIARIRRLLHTASTLRQAQRPKYFAVKDPAVAEFVEAPMLSAVKEPVEAPHNKSKVRSIDRIQSPIWCMKRPSEVPNALIHPFGTGKRILVYEPVENTKPVPGKPPWCTKIDHFSSMKSSPLRYLTLWVAKLWPREPGRATFRYFSYHSSADL